MVIRNEQMSAFAAAAEHRFEQAVFRMARVESCAAEYFDDELRGFVRSGIARARRTGLTLQSSIALYVLFMLRVAPDFDEHPAIRSLLLDPLSKPDIQIDYLAALIPGAIWQAAGRSRSPASIAA